MRGKPGRDLRFQQAFRIIPARAGQTSDVLDAVAVLSDHPRACGANQTFAEYARKGGGSSPRVRGKPPYVKGPADKPRIIPARAGQTETTVNPDALTTDHPRACGANVCDDRAIEAGAGSSPRVRGKRHAGELDALIGRIIPARAGQTCVSANTGARSSDHPRACGANGRQ